MNPQNVFYVGKMCTDAVQPNKYFKNSSKVRQTHRLDGSDSDSVSPLHPYYSRDYRSTNHIKLRSRRTGVVPEVQVCVFEWFSSSKRVFQIHGKSWFFTTYGSKKIVHGPNPLNGPYSAPILWKIMICWPNESSRRIICWKNTYRSCRAQ